MIELAQDDTQTINEDNRPGMLLALADHIEDHPQAREAIAAGVRIVAALFMFMDAQTGGTIKPEDNPAAGTEAGQVAPAGVDLVDVQIDAAGYPGAVL